MGWTPPGETGKCGLPDVGCQGSVPGWGVLGKEGRGVKRRIPGEGQGGGLSAGTQSLGDPPPPSSSNPWDRGERRVRAMGLGTLPDPLVRVLTGHRPGGEAAGPSCSGTEPRQVLWPRPLQSRRPPCGPGPSGRRNTSSGSPPPHALSGASPRPRAVPRVVGSARHPVGGRRGSRPRRTPRRAPGEPGRRSPSGQKNSAAPGLPCAARSWQPSQSARGAGPGLAKEAGKAQDWVAASGRSPSRTCGCDWGS